MIRTPNAADTPGILALAQATGMFSDDGVVELKGLLDDFCEGRLGKGHTWLVDDDSGPVGVVYYVPERMTEGTWNLLLIAVHPDRQGNGRGSALLSHVEATLASHGERILIVETSGLPDFERTRGFYRQRGYIEEARIRNFYQAGEDKVVFVKALSSPVV